MNKDYCGCCGIEYTGKDSSFCNDCLKHVAPKKWGVPDWERTYEAVYGVSCPLTRKVNGVGEDKTDITL